MLYGIHQFQEGLVFLKSAEWWEVLICRVRNFEDFIEARSENRETGGIKMTEKTIYLLLAAGILMILAGCIFGFMNQWIYAALVWVGAFGCCVAALNFKNKEK